MNKIKNIIGTILVISLLFGISYSVFAAEPNYEILTVTYENVDEILVNLINNDINSLIDGLERERGPQYKYYCDYLDVQYKTLAGYAGNQPAGGVMFPTGGGFYFSNSGGPSVSGSVNLSLPAPFDVVSISVNLGNSSTSGYFVTVPDTTHYYKLYINKTMKVQPYALYRARVGTEDWELYSSNAVSTEYSFSAYAIRVN